MMVHHHWSNFCYGFVFIIVVLNTEAYASTSLFKRIETAEQRFGDYFHFSRNDDGITKAVQHEINKPR